VVSNSRIKVSIVSLVGDAKERIKTLTLMMHQAC